MVRTRKRNQLFSSGRCATPEWSPRPATRSPSPRIAGDFNIAVMEHRRQRDAGADPRLAGRRPRHGRPNGRIIQFFRTRKEHRTFIDLAGLI